MVWGGVTPAVSPCLTFLSLCWRAHAGCPVTFRDGAEEEGWRGPALRLRPHERSECVCVFFFSRCLLLRPRLPPPFPSSPSSHLIATSISDRLPRRRARAHTHTQTYTCHTLTPTQRGDISISGKAVTVFFFIAPPSTMFFHLCPPPAARR